MNLSFVVDRKPVSVNATYKRGKGRRFYMSAEAKDYKASVRVNAFVAVQRSRWPNPERVKAVAVEITTYNTRHDVDAPTKATLDAMEGVVYYNDCAVQLVTTGKAKDDGAPRVEISVSLLEAA